MANGGTALDKNWDRAHSDINVLAQRVSGIEQSVAGITAAVDNLGKKLDAKPTNWIAFYGVAAALLTVAGGYLVQALAPRDATLSRHEESIVHISDGITHILETGVSKEDFKLSLEQQQRRNLAMDAAIAKAVDDAAAKSAKITDDLTATRIALAFASGEQTAWHEQYTKDDARHTSREDSIDSQQVKRPEIMALDAASEKIFTLAMAGLNERMNSVIMSVNELRRQFGDSFTMGDALKALEAWRNSFTAPPTPPPR